MNNLSLKEIIAIFQIIILTVAAKVSIQMLVLVQEGTMNVCLAKELQPMIDVPSLIETISANVIWNVKFLVIVVKIFLMHA